MKERHFGVVLEHIDSKFNQVLEGHAVLGKELKDFRRETRADIGSLEFGQKTLISEIGDMKVEIGDINVKIDRLEDKYDKNFDQILEYLSRIDEEIQDLKKVLSRKADLERLQALERRVAQVELVLKKYYESKNSN